MQSIISHRFPRYEALQCEVGEIKDEADLIITTAILGFVADQLKRGERVQIDWEVTEKNRFDKEKQIDKEKQEYFQAIARLNTILGELGYVSVGRTPDSEAHGIIIGLPSWLSELERNQARTYVVQRETGARSYNIPGVGVSLCELVATSSEKYFGEGINQRGAYTGMLMSTDRSEVDSQIVEPTHRVYVGKEPWKPTGDCPGWGTMGFQLEDGNNQNLPDDPKDKFGPVPESYNWRSDKYRIGYLHGMVIAIGHAQVRNNKLGETKRFVPVEVIAGTKTTKVASCFACATYMIASGFPPTSMHLGRSESWVPPAAGYLKTAEMSHRILSRESRERYRQNPRALVEDKVIQPQAEFVRVWRENICEYIKLGCQILNSNTSDINSTMKTPLNRLNGVLTMSPTPYDLQDKVSDMYLDALTVHEKDWKRIKNVFGI
ncbi:hypothetical protein PN462_20965 [Spirulina sp. CS-785/01]|uniref:hypothetical protein n=1 Tax=Spirulina sp. CS-785/01 TaxID=3021716 RepID=UPI00232FD762|nr:hypothetical protein [Spirulina sp. CS-785/01]MDB9315597.1 hypothetical protein [Spirulina sp. CS-785/01]